MPFAACAEGADTGAVRDIAVLTRVGRATCFVIESLDEDAEGRPLCRLSRARAQQMCREEYLDGLEPGDILPCAVTPHRVLRGLLRRGVRHQRPAAHRLHVGQPHFFPGRPGQRGAADPLRHPQPGQPGPLCADHPELLGTWAENAAAFTPGETVVGIVRSVEDYGTFVEIAPNLAGLAESCPDLRPGQAVSVYIKSILPEKMKRSSW